MVALRPSPNETVSATTLANCRPSPIAHSTVPASTTGKMPGRMLASMTANERKASPMKAATKTISMVSAAVELADHAGAVARRDRGQPGDRNPVARMHLAHVVERLVELLDDRQQAGSRRRRECGPDTTTASCSAEMNRRVRCSGRISTYCLSVATSALPAFSASQRRSEFERPDVADAGLLLDDRMHRRDGRERLRVVEARALGKLDQHVDRIGAGELGVEPAARLDRLPLVRHLVGQAVARLEVGVDDAKAADHQQGPAGCRARDG